MFSRVRASMPSKIGGEGFCAIASRRSEIFPETHWTNSKKSAGCNSWTGQEAIHQTRTNVYFSRLCRCASETIQGNWDSRSKLDTLHRRLHSVRVIDSLFNSFDTNAGQYCPEILAPVHHSIRKPLKNVYHLSPVAFESAHRAVVVKMFRRPRNLPSDPSPALETLFGHWAPTIAPNRTRTGKKSYSVL
jgi:hypothetical protein